MGSASFTARPKSAPSSAEPSTVQPKDAVELAAEDFELDHHEVERLAHGYWLARQGSNEGSAEEDWYRAERELREKRINGKPSANKPVDGKHATL